MMPELVYRPGNEQINKVFHAIEEIAFDEEEKAGVRLEALKYVFDHYALDEEERTYAEYLKSEIKELESRKGELADDIKTLEKQKATPEKEDVETVSDSGNAFWSGFFGWLNRSKSQDRTKNHKEDDDDA